MEWLSGLFYILICLFTSIYLIFKIRFTYWKKRGVPYIEPEIPFGNIRKKWKLRLLIDIFGDIYEEFKHKYPFAGAFFFSRVIVVVTDLELVKNVLVRDFNNFHERGIYVNEKDDPLSAHLFSLDGPKWKSLRSKLTPTFTSGRMKFMYPTLVDVADRFDKVLSETIKTDQVIEMKELLARFTTDIIGSCAFGIDCNSLNDPNAEFRNAGRMVFESPRYTNVIRGAIVTNFPDLARRLHIKTTKDAVTKFFMGVVRETVTFREQNKIRRNDFMDLLIELKNNDSITDGMGSKLTLEEIAAQAFVFFLAGFETSSTTMSYALYELALNHNIQEKARQEIQQVLNKHNGQFTYEAMMNMTYVDQIINESLRKYPPVVILMRKAANNYPVPNTDKIIEKGTSVFIPAYAIHHDPDIYPDPEIFNPDRFSPEEIQNRHPMAFLGFGDGPRNCIGLRFGRMQSRVGLITILRNYRINISEKTKIPLKFSKNSFILTPKGGLWLELERI